MSLSSVVKKTANAGNLKYSDPVVLRDNSQTRIVLVANYVPHNNGPQELKLKLVTYSKNKALGFVVNEDKTTQWLNEDEARLLLKALKSHLAVSQEDADGSYLIIKVEDGTAQIGAHDPSKVAQALTHVLSQNDILKHLQDTEISDELLKSFRSLIKLREMRSAVTTLRNMLDEGIIKESLYQNWCEKHSWAFGNAYIIRDDVRTISSGDKLDIILPKVISGYRDIVELKRPDMGILLWDETHKNYYFNSDTSKAIGQCHRYLDVFHEEAKNGLRDNPNVAAYHPRATIVIGRSDDWDDNKQKALHGLNSRLNNITIMTYDHLLAQGERLLEMITPGNSLDRNIEDSTNDDDIPF